MPISAWGLRSTDLSSSCSALGLLYIVGQLLTHFSYDLILRPLRTLATWREEQDFTNSDIDWMADYTFIRHKDAALGMEISKRYARTIMSRNNALVALLLMVVSLISRQWVGLIVCGRLFIFLSTRHMGSRGSSHATCRKSRRSCGRWMLRKREREKVGRAACIASYVLPLILKTSPIPLR